MLHQSKRIFAALSSSALLATSASADLLIHEAFDYTPTDPLNNGVFLGDGNQAGGLGLGPWRQVNSGSNEFDVITPGLTFTDGDGNVLPSAGGYAVRTNRVGQAAVSSDVDPGATAALTADNSTMWMSFLFVDRGFSGPTSALMLASEDMVFGDAHNLSAPGYGVGIVIRATVNPQRAIQTAYYNGTTSYTTKAEAVPTFLSTGGPENTAFLLAAKINWKPDGQLDEIHVFNITDLSAEPDEADALASDTFDMSLVNQQALDVLNIGETQIDGFDEIRVGTTFWDVTASQLVRNPADAGPGSLRQVIADAPDNARIIFDPEVFDSRENIIPLQSNLSLSTRTLTIDASNIAGGITLIGPASLQSFGGVFDVYGGASLTLRGLAIRDGRAITGGGISVNGNTTYLLAENCVFDSNSATGRGGGVYNQSLAKFINCTFTGNSSGESGAAVHTEGANGITELLHCTVTQNTSPASGAAVWTGQTSPATSSILSTIISDNIGGPDVGRSTAGSVLSQGGNLIGTGTANAIVAFNQTNDQTGVTDPKLAPLTWNGGTTQTQLPLPGSQALNNGRTNNNSPATDSRGLARVQQGSADVGAAEANWSFNTAASPPAGFDLAFDVTAPGDVIAALPFDNSPGGEGVANAINDTDAKYLNFSIDNCGFDVSPSLGSTQIIGLTITAANDRPGRDPATFLVIGQSPGRADTVIAAGQLTSFDRLTKETYYFSAPSTFFAKYSVVFPSIVGPPEPGDTFGNNSMQVAEVELLGVPSGGPTIDGSVDWDKNSDPGTFDASGSDKLVVVVTGEHNFPDNLTGDVTGITYNGEALTRAVEVSPEDPASGGHGQTTSEIWYLDDPGDFAGPGTIDVSFNGNNWVVTAFGLSGVADGVAATAGLGGSASVNLTTPSRASLVIGAVGMGGTGNTASPLPGVGAFAPLTTITGLEIGSNWAGHAVGAGIIGAPGDLTVAFDTSNLDVVTVAAAFESAAFATDPYGDWAEENIPDGLDRSFGGDADLDGLANGAEYFAGTDPVTPDASSASASVSVQADGGRIILLPSAPAARPDVALVIWRSTDLVNFEEVYSDVSGELVEAPGFCLCFLQGNNLGFTDSADLGGGGYYQFEYILRP